MSNRFKLDSDVVSLFREISEKVIIRGFPEGCLGVYPEKTWEEEKRKELKKVEFLSTLDARVRRLKRELGQSDTQTISNQGRLTIPARFREKYGLNSGSKITIVGCDDYIEIWPSDLWLEAEAGIYNYEETKMKEELAEGLNSQGSPTNEDEK